MNRTIRLLAAIALASGCARDHGVPPASPAGPPDVLLVTIDTFRADHAGCLGNPDGLTPTIDRIARAGRLAPDAFCPAPLTAVSHASLLTGLEPPTHGVRENTLFHLDADIPTIASLLRENGFTTGGFVSAVPLAARFGFDSGFDEYDDDFGADPGWLAYARRPAGATVDATLRWIAGLPPDRRWFLWVHFFDPHYPLSPPPELKKLPVADDYDRVIVATDRQLRRLLQALELRAGREPVIALVSDHGEGQGGHGELSHGLLLYQETMHGLFAMSAPPGTPEHDRLGTGPFPGVVTYCDLVPTLFDVLDLPLSDRTEGRSLLATADPEGGAYGETYYPAIHYGWSPLLSWRNERWTYVAGPDPELYDRVKDPGERRNVIAAHPDVASALAQRIDDEARDPVPQDATGPAAETRAQMESLGYVSGKSDFSYDSDKNPRKLVGAANAIFRGMGQLARGDVAGAHASFQYAYQIDPDNVTAVAYLADTFYALGNVSTAMDYYRRAVELSPRAATAFAHLAVLQFDHGNREEAFTLLKRGLAASPDAFSLLVTAGDLYRDSGRADEARAMYERATKSEPNRPEAWAGLARLAVRQGDRTEGERLWKKAMALDGSGALRGQTLDGTAGR